MSKLALLALEWFLPFLLIAAAVAFKIFEHFSPGANAQRRLKGFRDAVKQLGMERVEADTALIPARDAKKAARDTMEMRGSYEGAEASVLLRARWRPPGATARFRGTYAEVELGCPHLDDPTLRLEGEQEMTGAKTKQRETMWQEIIFPLTLTRGAVRLTAPCDALLPVIFPDIDQRRLTQQFYQDIRLMRLVVEENRLHALYLLQLEDTYATEETIPALLHRTHRMAEEMRWTSPARISKWLHAVRARVDEDSPLRAQLIRALCTATTREEAVTYTSGLLRDQAMNDLSVAFLAAPDLFEEPARVKRLVRASIHALGDGDEQTSLSAIKLLAQLDAADALPALPTLLAARDRARGDAVPNHAHGLIATLQGVADEASERGGLSLANDPQTAGALSLSQRETGGEDALSGYDEPHRRS